MECEYKAIGIKLEFGVCNDHLAQYTQETAPVIEILARQLPIMEEIEEKQLAENVCTMCMRSEWVDQEDADEDHICDDCANRETLDEILETPELVSCQACDGTGHTKDDEKCFECWGTGLVSEEPFERYLAK